MSGSIGLRAAAPGGQPQLPRSTSSVGSSSTRGGRSGSGDALEQPGAGPLAELAHGLVDGGERRVDDAPEEDVIETDHGHVLGNPHPGPAERLQHADRHLVVGADHGVGQAPPGRASRLAPASSPLCTLNRPLNVPTSWHVRVRLQHVSQREPPLLGVGGGARPVHVKQPPRAVGLDEVAHQGGGAGPVVRGDHVGRALLRVSRPPPRPAGGGPGGPRPTRGRCPPRSAGRRPCRTATAAGGCRGRWPLAGT